MDQIESSKRITIQSNPDKIISNRNDIVLYQETPIPSYKSGYALIKYWKFISSPWIFHLSENVTTCNVTTSIPKTNTKIESLVYLSKHQTSSSFKKNILSLLIKKMFIKGHEIIKLAGNKNKTQNIYLKKLTSCIHPNESENLLSISFYIQEELKDSKNIISKKSNIIPSTRVLRSRKKKIDYIFQSKPKKNDDIVQPKPKKMKLMRPKKVAKNSKTKKIVKMGQNSKEDIFKLKAAFKRHITKIDRGIPVENKINLDENNIKDVNNKNQPIIVIKSLVPAKPSTVSSRTNNRKVQRKIFPPTIISTKDQYFDPKTVQNISKTDDFNKNKNSSDNTTLASNKTGNIKMSYQDFHNNFICLETLQKNIHKPRRILPKTNYNGYYGNSGKSFDSLSKTVNCSVDISQSRSNLDKTIQNKRMCNIFKPQNQQYVNKNGYNTVGNNMIQVSNTILKNRDSALSTDQKKSTCGSYRVFNNPENQPDYLDVIDPDPFIDNTIINHFNYHECNVQLYLDIMSDKYLSFYFEDRTKGKDDNCFTEDDSYNGSEYKQSKSPKAIVAKTSNRNPEQNKPESIQESIHDQVYCLPNIPFANLNLNYDKSDSFWKKVLRQYIFKNYNITNINELGKPREQPQLNINMNLNLMQNEL
ncbi:hypothetical protein BB559_007450 [Furculomyces boomerangus]|uniref:Uncharacterized protein n=1 Tax=Furculomyces boomerangus TaxID=61424 RepID=A0A2T9XXC5_9FUNG|nr:hypothetical protein BB559_007450 [Furculomyces boomerangus]